MGIGYYIYKQPQSTYPYKKRVEFFLLISTVLLVILFGPALIIKPVNSSHIITPIIIANALQKQEVLGVIALTPTPTPTPTPLLTETPTPTPVPLKAPVKKSYSIAVFGDSMEDTMGERLEYLEHALKAKYPQTNFDLYNYGVGSQNVADGVARFNSNFSYKTRNYPSLSQLKPDILIIGSFAYNPFAPQDVNKYWTTLSQLMQTAKSVSSQVYMLAEIAPLKKNFGKGPNGVNWDENTSYQHATQIIELLESDSALSKSLNIPLINAFYPSQINSYKEGNPTYVNPSDGIHPSVLGHEFIANLIAASLKLN